MHSECDRHRKSCTRCLITGIESTVPKCSDSADTSNISAFFLVVSRLQAKYKGCLGKREYQKKREAGMGSKIKDSLLRAMFSNRSCSFGKP